MKILRILSLLLAGAGVLALGACTDSVADDPKDASPETEANTPAKSASKPDADEAADAGPIEAALVKANEEGKNVLVEYWSRTCPYCTQMDDQTLSTNEVKEALGGVVYVRILKEADHRPFTSRWPGAGTPSYAVLKPSGKQVGTVLSGAVAKSDFLTYLSWAESGEGSQPSFNVGGT